MLCDICKQNEAKVHLTQIIEGKTKKIDLCEACSKSKGVDDTTGFSLADLLLGLGAAQEMEKANTPAGMAKCPACGLTQADFKKTGRLGCPECYQTYAEGLDGLLKSMHKGTRHVGKIPQSFQVSQDIEDRIRHLQKRLDKVIAEENFEQAAVLRDEIKSLRAQHSSLQA